MDEAVKAKVKKLSNLMQPTPAATERSEGGRVASN
jgi:hypothetical protein